VSITPQTVAALERQKAKEASTRVVARGGPPPGTIFVTETGRWMRGSAGHFSRMWHDLLRRAGISGFRFHDLRHTCATLLLLANVHPKIVSERLGHASIQITLDTYSHLLPSMQATAVTALQGLLPQVQ
jgi:integrase